MIGLSAFFTAAWGGGLPGVVSFWGSLGCECPSWLSCSDVTNGYDYDGLEEGSTPDTCISTRWGDEIPKYIAVIIGGESTGTSCGGNYPEETYPCLENVTDINPHAGLHVLHLSVSDSYHDEWVSTLGITHVYRMTEEDWWPGKVRLFVEDTMFLPDAYHTSLARTQGIYDSLPSMMAPRLLDGDISQAFWGYFDGPCEWNSYWGCRVRTSPDGIHQLVFPIGMGSLTCCDENEDPITNEEECVATEPSLIFGTMDCDTPIPCNTSAPYGHRIKDALTAAIYPITVRDQSHCTHGPYCSNDYFLEDNPNSRGTCCITASISGLGMPEESKCFFGFMESDVDPLVVKYRHYSSGYFYSAPYGCLGPFPSWLTAISSQTTVDDCQVTDFTVTLTGGDIIWTESGPVIRTVAFSAELRVAKAWWKLMASDLESLVLDFDEALSSNLDLGYSLDFSNASVTLALNNEEYDDCGNELDENPFVDVDYWDLRFTMVKQRMLYYDEIYWLFPDGPGPKTGPYNRRYMVPIKEGLTWDMYDSENPAIRFEFDSDDSVGTHVRNGVTFDNVKVPFNDDDSDEQTIDKITAAVNAKFGGDFFMYAWDAWEPEVKAFMEELIAVNYEEHQWDVGEVSENEPVITTMVYLGEGEEDAPQFMRAGSMKIGTPWHNFAIELTYNGATIGVEDGATFTIDDGVHDPVIFEFDSDSSVESGHVAVAISLTAKLTMAAVIGAINGVPDLDITAVAHDPPDETCTLWQVIDGKDTQVGSMQMTRDWFTYDEETGEVVVRFDQVGVPGEYWYNEGWPVGVWVWSDLRRRNAFIVQLLFDFCYRGGLHYSFCSPGWAVQPGAFGCVIDDPDQICGYKNGTAWTLTPHYVDRG
jgi:hypothetical protein